MTTSQSTHEKLDAIFRAAIEHNETYYLTDAGRRLLYDLCKTKVERLELSEDEQQLALEKLCRAVGM